MLTKLFAFCGTLATLFGVIFLMVHFIRQHDADERRAVLLVPGLVKGRVVQKRSYKGTGMTVRYRVGGQEYELGTGVKDAVFAQYEVGDSIQLLYSRRAVDKAVIRHEGLIN